MRESDDKQKPRLLDKADHYAQHMAQVPVRVVVCYALDDVVPVDR